MDDENVSQRQPERDLDLIRAIIVMEENDKAAIAEVRRRRKLESRLRVQSAATRFRRKHKVATPPLATRLRAVERLEQMKRSNSRHSMKRLYSRWAKQPPFADAFRDPV